MARRVRGCSGGCAASGVSLGEAATGTDLGGSSIAVLTAIKPMHWLASKKNNNLDMSIK